MGLCINLMTTFESGAPSINIYSRGIQLFASASTREAVFLGSGYSCNKAHSISLHLDLFRIYTFIREIAINVLYYKYTV